jgi:hypothetical protein
MAEFVTHAERQADLAHLDARFDRMEALLIQHLAETEAHLERSLTRTATFAGLAAGFVAAIPAYIAVTMALVRVFAQP